eukprot:SAG31_NODE_4958_length_2834_cov_2.231079_1_plen_54_part_10
MNQQHRANVRQNTMLQICESSEVSIRVIFHTKSSINISSVSIIHRNATNESFPY